MINETFICEKCCIVVHKKDFPYKNGAIYDELKKLKMCYYCISRFELGKIYSKVNRNA
jgi:hypothetical protein